MPKGQTPKAYRQRTILERIIRRHSSTQQQVKRARLVLEIAAGKNNEQAALAICVSRQTSIRWRSRWLKALPELTAAEITNVSDNELMAIVEQVLSDEPRSGTPLKYNAEQVTQIIALACSDPEKSGCSISHWSGSDLALEAVRRLIVENISPRSVQRFLKRSRSQTPSLSVLVKCESRQCRRVYA